ncbi:MAG: hypothetical protein IJZ07_03845 [Clostridia bacterium]|nr:hypothetical protein [Clostridia bacterium]
MYFKDEFSKREKIREDLSGVFRKLETDSNLISCIGAVLSCEVPLGDMLNPKALGKVINNTLGYPHQVNTYPFGDATNMIHPSFLTICNKKNSFRQTLTAMVNHGIKYGDRIREMVMLTNFWDSKDFKEYEESFEILRRKYGISISVILITEYSANIVF